MENAGLLWIIFGIFLMIAEIFTFGFVLFWFGIGAFVAAFFGFLGVGLVGQFFIFALVSGILTAMSRTLFKKFLSRGEKDQLKTGVEALPGKIGTVSVASKGALKEAAVKVYGSEWTAFPADGVSELREGEKVEVVRLEGSSIYVKRIGTPPERGDWH
jgi:inner membrane protein